MNKESLQPKEKKERIDTISFGLYIPQKTLTNQEIESWQVKTPGGNMLTAEDILKRTGIERRHIATKAETIEYMALAASDQAMGKKRRAGLLIATTSYPTRNLSQHIMDTKNYSNLVNMDIYAACSGFVRGLSFMKTHENTFMGHSVLMVASEKYSDKVFDLKKGVEDDPSLAQTIFSDGAVAMHFIYGKDLRVLSANNRKLPGDLTASIKMPIDRNRMRPVYIEESVPLSPSGKFEQDGKTVYRAVIENVPKLIIQTIDKAHLKEKDIKLIIPHQGSGHIVDGLQKHLPNMPVFKDVEDGNFSSASIPKAILRAREEGLIHRKDRVVLAGFGAGLFASVAVVEFH